MIISQKLTDNHFLFEINDVCRIQFPGIQTDIGQLAGTAAHPSAEYDEPAVVGDLTGLSGVLIIPDAAASRGGVQPDSVYVNQLVIDPLSLVTQVIALTDLIDGVFRRVLLMVDSHRVL